MLCIRHLTKSWGFTCGLCPQALGCGQLSGRRVSQLRPVTWVVVSQTRLEEERFRKMGPHGQRLGEEGENVWESWKKKNAEWWRHTIRLERKAEVRSQSCRIPSPAREPRLDLARHRHTSALLLSFHHLLPQWTSDGMNDLRPDFRMMGSWSPKGRCVAPVELWSIRGLSPCRWSRAWDTLRADLIG